MCLWIKIFNYYLTSSVTFTGYQWEISGTASPTGETGNGLLEGPQPSVLLGVGPQIVPPLSGYTVEAVRPPLVCLPSLRHWKELFNRPLLESQSSQSAHAHTQRTPVLRPEDPKRKSLSTWHPNTSVGSFSWEATQIPKAHTVIYFLSTARKYGTDSWMGA